jgi:folate-binding protein YgfZ
MTIARLADRAVLAVAGADSKAFLQGLLTQDVMLLADERPLYAGLLSPQGKALFDMLLFAGPDDSVLIDVAADRAAALARRLGLYKLRKAVSIAPADLAVWAGWDGAGQGAADPRDPALGRRWLAPAGASDASRDGSATYAAHRLAAGIPDSADIGEDQYLWLETGADLLQGVSFAKGCYVGQENTARMHHRDKVRRRLVPLVFDGVPDPADLADGIVRDAAGQAVGTLRSQAGGRGIAHLRLEAAGGPLRIGTRPVTVARPAWLAPALAAAAPGTGA